MSSSSSSYLTKVCICAAGLGLVWYFSSGSTKPKQSNDETLQLIRKFCDKLYPQMKIISQQAAMMARLDPRFSPQTAFGLFAPTLEKLEKEILAEMGYEDASLGEILQNCEETPEFLAAQEEYENLILSAISGRQVMPPFYQVPSDFSLDEFFDIYKGLKMAKADNFEKIFNDMKEKAGTIVQRGDQFGVSFSEEAGDLLVKLANETDEKFLKNGSRPEWFPNGIESLETLVMKRAAEDTEMQARLIMVSEEQSEKIQTLLKELFPLYKKVEEKEEKIIEEIVDGEMEEKKDEKIAEEIIIDDNDQVEAATASEDEEKTEEVVTAVEVEEEQKNCDEEVISTPAAVAEEVQEEGEKSKEEETTA